jgi:surface antigen
MGRTAFLGISAALALTAVAMQTVSAQPYGYSPPATNYPPPPPAYDNNYPPAPAYAAPPPAYGNYPAPGYPAPQYSAPPPAYGAPPPGYAAYRCEERHEGNTAGGAILGAIAGGLLGSAASNGHGAGTAVGAIAGGLLGASIGGSLPCNDQRSAYNVYYSGFEAGRPHHRYDWRSPYDRSYGSLEVGDYYTGPEGFRCATYTQRIYVDGRPQLATGHACRRPDGSWQMLG